MSLQQVHSQGRPAHLRLRLGRAEVPYPGQMEPSLHRPEHPLDLEADGADLFVEGLQERIRGLAGAALVLNQITNAPFLEPLAADSARVAFVS